MEPGIFRVHQILLQDRNRLYEPTPLQSEPFNNITHVVILGSIMVIHVGPSAIKSSTFCYFIVFAGCDFFGLFSEIL